MSRFSVFIPLLPPGLNQSYLIGKNGDNKGFLYKSEEANRWAEGAALIIGAEAGHQDWKDDSATYEIMIHLHDSRHDVDAPVKLILDTVSQKLGFDDKKFTQQCSRRVKSDVKGVYIEIRPL